VTESQAQKRAEEYAVKHANQVSDPENAEWHGRYSSAKHAYLAAWNDLAPKIEKLVKALEFYADQEKYFKKKETINLKQTTAIFHVGDPSSLEERFVAESWECTARIKLDHGTKALETLKQWKEGV